MMWLLLLGLAQTDPVTPSEKDILAWIRMLSSDVVEKRNEAFRKLEEAGETAIPFVQKAMNGGDGELQGRCRELIARNELESGVRELVGLGREVPEMKCDPARKKEFETLVVSGKVDDLLKRDYDWFTYAFDGLLSDQKPVVLGSLQFIHGMIRNRAIPDVPSILVKEKPDLRKYRSAASRADEYRWWALWSTTKWARHRVTEWEKGPSAETEEWEESLRQLGTGWRDGDEKKLFQRIQSYGTSAYSHLIDFIDAEDLSLGTTAVLVLKALTGKESPDRVTLSNKVKLKEQWSDWLRSRK